MDVAVYGGSFNPPHFSHVMAVTYARAAFADLVVVIPTSCHPFGKNLAPFEDRMAMCQDAFSMLRGVEVSDLERQLGGESRTLRTLQHLQEAHGDWRMRLLVGADVLAESGKWHRFDLISEIAPPFVIGRSGHDGHTGQILPSMSSTDVRAAVASKDFQYLSKALPKAVLDRIMSRNLYAV